MHCSCNPRLDAHDKPHRITVMDDGMYISDYGGRVYLRGENRDGNRSTHWDHFPRSGSHKPRKTYGQLRSALFACGLCEADIESALANQREEDIAHGREDTTGEPCEERKE